MFRKRATLADKVAGELSAAPVTQLGKKSETLCSSFYHWVQMEIDSLRKFNFPIKMLMKP